MRMAQTLVEILALAKLVIHVKYGIFIYLFLFRGTGLLQFEISIFSFNFKYFKRKTLLSLISFVTFLQVKNNNISDSKVLQMYKHIQHVDFRIYTKR